MKKTLVAVGILAISVGTAAGAYLVELEGGNLVIEQTAPGRGGGEPTTTKLVYKKG